MFVLPLFGLLFERGPIKTCGRATTFLNVPLLVIPKAASSQDRLVVSDVSVAGPCNRASSTDCATGSMLVDRELLGKMFKQRPQCGASGSLKLMVVSKCLFFCKIAQFSDKVNIDTKTVCPCQSLQYPCFARIAFLKHGCTPKGEITGGQL